MKKAKKILTLVACAVLLVCISVGATLAYLQAQTEAVTNTFTVGDIDIYLDEAEVELNEDDDYVAKANGSRVEENETQNYKLHPGISVEKDPTIHLVPTSENCYIVAKVVVSVKDGDGEDANTIAGLRELLGGYYEVSDKLIGFGGIVIGGAMGENVTLGTENVAPNTIYYFNDEVYLTQTATDTENIFYVYWKDENVLPASGTRGEADKTAYVVFDHIVIPGTYDGDDMAKLAGLNIEVQGFAVQADGFKGVVDAFKAAFPGEYATAGLPVEGN